MSSSSQRKYNHSTKSYYYVPPSNDASALSAMSEKLTPFIPDLSIVPDTRENSELGVTLDALEPGVTEDSLIRTLNKPDFKTSKLVKRSEKLKERIDNNSEHSADSSEIDQRGEMISLEPQVMVDSVDAIPGGSIRIAKETPARRIDREEVSKKDSFNPGVLESPVHNNEIQCQCQHSLDIQNIFKRLDQLEEKLENMSRYPAPTAIEVIEAPPAPTITVPSVSNPIQKSNGQKRKTELVSRTPVSTQNGESSSKGVENVPLLSSDEKDEPKAKIFKPENVVSVALATYRESLRKNVLRVDAENLRRNVLLQPELDADPEDAIEAIESMMSSSVSSGSYTTVACRSIRIGDYKNVAATRPNFKVVFHPKGILFSIPHALNKTQMIKCAIPTGKILYMAAHFRQRLPLVFLSTGPDYAIWLREKLGLAEHSSNSPYYCYLNGGKCQKYITFLADEFKDSDVVVMKRTYGKTLQEIDYLRANVLLMKITPDVKVINKSHSV